jgi:transcription antitermination factor NusG
MWYVLNATPHCEPQVAKLLGQLMVEAYVPRFPAALRTKPGSARDLRPRLVFPGYVFFRTPVGFSHWDVVRWTPGVRRILLEDTAPAVIADEVVAHLRRRLAEGSLRPVVQRFKPGQVVTIERGPLAQVDAIFDRELDARSRVQVLVHMMGRSITFRIDPADLRSAAV